MRISSINNTNINGIYQSKVKKEKQNDDVRRQKPISEREIMKDFGIGRHVDARI